MSRPPRQPSHGSGLNLTSQIIPRGLSIFRRAATPASREEPVISPGLIHIPPHSELEVNPPISLPEVKSRQSASSPDPFLTAAHDPDYIRLCDITRQFRRTTPLKKSDPKSIDASWENYMRLREESIGHCRKLIYKSQHHGRNVSFESNIGPLDTRSSYSSGSNNDNSLSFQVNNQWLSAIRDYKKIQETMLNTLFTSLMLTFNEYEPEASQRQFEAFLSDKERRRNRIMKWRDTSVVRLRSEKPEFFDKYRLRASNYDRLKLDIEDSERLFDIDETAHLKDRVIRDVVITRGDTILEFANRSSNDLPILRFRVSSHSLVDLSPLFSYMLSPPSPGTGIPLEMLNDLPRAPFKTIAKDGTDVKVYSMPQTEANRHEALTTLLHAAHLHEVKLDNIRFPAFVSIADVCLRYMCTSPLELQVRYQALPKWEDKAADDNPNELLLIAYVFGKRDLFTRISKNIILNAKSDNGIQGKECLPQTIRDKIKAIRAAKLAQIYECCTNTIEEYLQPPLEHPERPAQVGSLKLTTKPRCPRGSHVCDATSLGSLMQVFNELHVLPSFWRSTKAAPERSLKELIDNLRLMPSPPQTHSGVCDYAPAFRDSINNIANSIVGLTLFDVSGQHGWALSRSDPPQSKYDDVTPEVHELPARVRSETTESIVLANEAIRLRILAHLETLEDLQVAAMVDKMFYNTYKRNEVLLMRNIVKAATWRRPRSMEVAATPISGSKVLAAPANTLDAAAVELMDDSESAISDQSEPVSSISQDDEIYTPSLPPISMGIETKLSSEEEAHRFLTRNVEETSRAYASRSPLESPSGDVEHSEQKEKFLAGDFAHVEDKARIGEDDMTKQLRDEKDRVLSARGGNSVDVSYL